MSNAKLVFEMPTCCIDCKVSYLSSLSENNLHCSVLQDDCPYEGVHQDCPLIETSEEECC